MINEVDGALRNLVTTEVANGTDVEIVFDAPTREWASRRSSPAIDLYLYDIREDIRRRTTGMVERRDSQGVVVNRESLPRYFKLAYLITAWTQRPEDEHRLLSAILACFLRFDVMPASALTSVLSDLNIPLGLQMAYPPPEDRQVSDVWSSLGGDLKPSIDLVVTLPVQPDVLLPIAQAVMKPLRLRSVGQITNDADDGIRHLPDRVDPEPPTAGPGSAKHGGASRPATNRRPRRSKGS